MEKQNQSSLSLLALLPDGKVENDVRITDKTVTGICTVYVKRTDNENEFLLREIGVAALDGSNLNEAVRTAVNEAYDAAISHIAGFTPSAELQQPQVSGKTDGRGAKPIPGLKPEPEAKTPAPAPDESNAPDTQNTAEIPKNGEPADASDTGTGTHPSVDLRSIVDIPEKNGANPDAQADAPPAQAGGNDDSSAENGGIERIEFSSSLFPASDLIKSSEAENNAGEDDDGVDPEYKKALDTEITIFGKLHDCTGWKAGKILNERPDVIVDFCHRNSEDFNGPKYTGPRVEQKEALFKLYPDAIRKVDRAA